MNVMAQGSLSSVRLIGCALLWLLQQCYGVVDSDGAYSAQLASNCSSSELCFDVSSTTSSSESLNACTGFSIDHLDIYTVPSCQGSITGYYVGSNSTWNSITYDVDKGLVLLRNAGQQGLSTGGRVRLTLDPSICSPVSWKGLRLEASSVSIDVHGRSSTGKACLAEAELDIVQPSASGHGTLQRTAGLQRWSGALSMELPGKAIKAADSAGSSSGTSAAAIGFVHSSTLGSARKTAAVAGAVPAGLTLAPAGVIPQPIRSIADTRLFFRFLVNDIYAGTYHPDRQVTFQQAQARCRAIGARLPGFRNRAGLAWLLDNLAPLELGPSGGWTRYSSLDLWLGGYRPDPFSDFIWDDKTPPGFRPWPPRPDDQGDCIAATFGRFPRSPTAASRHTDFQLESVPYYLATTDCNATKAGFVCVRGEPDRYTVETCPADTLQIGAAVAAGCHIGRRPFWGHYTNFPSRCLWILEGFAACPQAIRYTGRYRVNPGQGDTWNSIAASFCSNPDTLPLFNPWVRVAQARGLGPGTRLHFSYSLLNMCGDRTYLRLPALGSLAAYAAGFCTSTADVLRLNRDNFVLDDDFGSILRFNTEAANGNPNNNVLLFVNRCNGCFPYVIRSATDTNLAAIAARYGASAAEVAFHSSLPQGTATTLINGQSLLICPKNVPDPCSRCRDLNCACSCNSKASGNYPNPFDSSCTTYLNCERGADGVSRPNGIYGCGPGTFLDSVTRLCLPTWRLSPNHTCPARPPCDDYTCFCSTRIDGLYDSPFVDSQNREGVQCRGRAVLQVIRCNAAQGFFFSAAGGGCQAAAGGPLAVPGFNDRATFCTRLECLCALRYRQFQRSRPTRYLNVFDPTGRTVAVCAGQVLLGLEGCPYGTVAFSWFPELPLFFDASRGGVSYICRTLASYNMPWTRSMGMIADYDSVPPTSTPQLGLPPVAGARPPPPPPPATLGTCPCRTCRCTTFVAVSASSRANFYDCSAPEPARCAARLRS